MKKLLSLITWDKLLSLIIGLMLFMVFLFLVWNEFSTHKQMKEYSIIQGKIISSEFEKSCEKKRVYDLKNISYSYSINNIEYVSNKVEPYISSACGSFKPDTVLFTFSDDFEKQGQKIMDRYKIGETVSVYVNNQQPNNAFIVIDKLGVEHYIEFLFFLIMSLVFSISFISIPIISIKENYLKKQEQEQQSS